MTDVECPKLATRPKLGLLCEAGCTLSTGEDDISIHVSCKALTHISPRVSDTPPRKRSDIGTDPKDAHGVPTPGVNTG